MKTDQHKTLVVFREYKDTGETLALFPEIDEGGYRCSCYERIGQHGAADYAHCIRITNPARDPSKLQKELEGLGYNLDIKQRYTKR